jgi:hypothetical protein
LPVYYRARSYQQPLWAAFRAGLTRHVAVWHRRGGKDTTFLNITVCAMMKRVGNYRHIFPTLKLGREVLWDGIDGQGRRFIEAFPESLIYEKNESELSITLVHPDNRKKPGSQWQLMGTDRNVNAVVGGNPVGFVFSEYALQHPMAWVLAQPILRENGGWAGFPYTPRARNHGYDLYQAALANPAEWSCSKLTIDDTRRDAEGESGGPVITAAQVRADVEAGLMDEATAEQEYWVSFDSPLQGAYYAEQFKRADADGRVTTVPWQPQYPVYTAWDLGLRESDTMNIWFIQPVGDRLNCIDHYENFGQGMEHYVKVLKDKPYIYAGHLGPHDIEQRELTATLPGSTEARTRKAMAHSLGLDFTTVAQWPVIDGIQAVRTIFARLWFDAVKCKLAVKALREYQRLYDDKLKVFQNTPLHNWCSNFADSLRTFAMGYQAKQLTRPPQRFATASGNPLSGHGPQRTASGPGRR